MTDHHLSYAALSYSRTLLPHGQPLAQRWRIEHHHRHACNLRSDQGHYLAIVSPRYGNGPFHIVTPLAVLNSLPHAGQLDWVDGQLLGAQVTIRLHSAQPWEPRLPMLPTPPPWPVLAQLLGPYPEHLQTLLSQPDARLPALAVALNAGLEELKRGFHTNNPALLTAGIERLAGLGPGLTPAGDDLLLGMLAGLWLGQGERWPAARVQAISAQVEMLAGPRTTSLSATWLRHAAQGEFGAAWHRLTHALSTQQRPTIHLALEHIAAHGATSGLAALTGLAICYSASYNQPNQPLG